MTQRQSERLRFCSGSSHLLLTLTSERSSLLLSLVSFLFFLFQSRCVCRNAALNFFFHLFAIVISLAFNLHHGESIVDG